MLSQDMNVKCSLQLMMCWLELFVQVEGAIPQELVGTYLRNGPGMQVHLTLRQRRLQSGIKLVLFGLGWGRAACVMAVQR
jgi:hypothetical protein